MLNIVQPAVYTRGVSVVKKQRNEVKLSIEKSQSQTGGILVSRMKVTLMVGVKLSPTSC